MTRVSQRRAEDRRSRRSSESAGVGGEERIFGGAELEVESREYKMKWVAKGESLGGRVGGWMWTNPRRYFSFSASNQLQRTT